ncbi:endonuclease/exonuclease/phosphatase family protein [Jiella endophytica]|uniref:Endonuclease/exonuclease/phosphatase family protein n=1 Tax=Jiella endophytica TaxID=2558362 RepID=A0A4Y8R8Y7_9HYPH|nr:endonuclease/exonuclease/phosphatase family protein [Jiella endophytica]TFF18083.1 endonuclease/exonuclease/phosphatase family protein [Jiella endophytica]
MRIASYNVENLFDRAKVFNVDDHGPHQEIIDAYAELSKLFEKEDYSDQDKTRMLELLGVLGLLNRDEGEFAFLRKIRGRLIRRPRDRSEPKEIVANGRGDWVGWVELKTEPVDEMAMILTARVIFEIEADVIGVVEAESRPVLTMFQDFMAKKFDLEVPYAHVMLIDGNDQRGIDVAIGTREGYDIVSMRSHVDDLMANSERVFSRDCPEYTVVTPSGNRIVLLVNHFKSKFGGNDPASQAQRLAQAKAVAGYYKRLRDEGIDNIVVLGDLNDTPDSEELKPLIEGTDLKDASTSEKFTEFEFRADNGNRGIGTFGLGNDDDKIDYMLLSPALFGRIEKGGIFRKGAWPGSRPPRWDVYPELTAPLHAASDHHLLWVDIDL